QSGLAQADVGLGAMEAVGGRGLGVSEEEDAGFSQCLALKVDSVIRTGAHVLARFRAIRIADGLDYAHDGGLNSPGRPIGQAPPLAVLIEEF
ncbi:hypothetical protein ACYOEI_03135, partial [Singulisphaera rosea]